MYCILPVKRNVDNSDEEGIKMKEQAILELGQLLAETKQAEGIRSCFVMKQIYKNIVGNFLFNFG